jgi:hypothetical protein
MAFKRMAKGDGHALDLGEGLAHGSDSEPLQQLVWANGTNCFYKLSR